MTIDIKKRQIVLPGDKLATKGSEYILGKGVYDKDDTIFSAVLGLAEPDERKVSVIPFTQVYLPQKYQQIIGKIVGTNQNGWWVNIGTPTNAFLHYTEGGMFLRDEDRSNLERFYAIDSYVCVKIKEINYPHVDLTMRGLFFKEIVAGKILSINPSKVPRVLGKHNSMISALQAYSKAKIIVGYNGYIYIRGTPTAEDNIIQILDFIEKNAHKDGITNIVEEKLKSIFGEISGSTNSDFSNGEYEQDEQENNSEVKEKTTIIRRMGER